MTCVGTRDSYYTISKKKKKFNILFDSDFVTVILYKRAVHICMIQINSRADNKGRRECTYMEK